MAEQRGVPAAIPGPCRYQVEREIRIHIKLEHENIIKLYAAFEDQKNVYMVQVRVCAQLRACVYASNAATYRVGT